MSILNNLRLVKNELYNQKHPLAKEDVTFRQLYVTGYAMLICVGGYPSEMAKDVLKKQVELLDLPAEYKKIAIKIALDADVNMIHNLLKTLNEPRHKYIFMLDLYNYAQIDRKISEKEQELLVLFEELLQFSYEEIQFIRSFRLAMMKKDLELGRKVVQDAFEQKVKVPLNDLSFFLPNFHYQEKLNQTTLLKGQKKKLSYATLLTGEVIVGNGAELDLNGMDVTFANDAAIIIDGGELKANGAKLIASMDANRTMLSIRNVEKMKIMNAHFFGAGNVRAIEMNNAKVELDGCSFEKCFDEERGGAIYFTNSDSFILRNCLFELNSTYGKGGSMYIAGTEASHMRGRDFFNRITRRVQKVKLIMEGCRFKNSRAEMSGALHIYDAEIDIKNTTFEECKSRIGGAAIDTLNCQLKASDNTFIKCRAPLNAAAVVVGGLKLEEVGKIGEFKECEPKDIIVK